jgi:ABC-type spermidine/putrescine transport system permease subunit I
MSRDGYLIDPQASIRKSWWRNLFEIAVVVPSVLILVAAVYVWILFLPGKIDG